MDSIVLRGSLHDTQCMACSGIAYPAFFVLRHHHWLSDGRLCHLLRFFETAAAARVSRVAVLTIRRFLFSRSSRDAWWEANRNFRLIQIEKQRSIQERHPQTRKALARARESGCKLRLGRRHSFRDQILDVVGRCSEAVRGVTSRPSNATARGRNLFTTKFERHWIVM